MLRLWIQAGFAPETFGRQTERSYVIAIEAAAERQKREVERDRLLAYNIAALTGCAFAGKLKPFAEHFPPLDEETESGMTDDSAKMLSALFKLKSRGVTMTVEKISLH